MAENSNTLLTLSYFVLFGQWAISSVVILPVSFSLVLTSTLILYIGCHRSLKLLLTEENGGTPKSEKEVLSVNDAYKFPFVGSAALLSLYIAFKVMDKDSVNLLLSLYFSLIGVFTLTTTFSPFLASFFTNPAKTGYKFTLPLFGAVDATFTTAEFIAFVFAIIFSYVYFRTKHFLLNNVLGISFCIQSIERISLGSYKNGAIALIGLFFYDIFWVFGTEVMVTVAKSFDGPIKLLFPRSFATETAKAQFSLLGLGDIVIPGLFVALLLRYDAYRANVAQTENIVYETFDKTFFHVNIIFYALGLVTTVFVMYYFEAAQPALLYLVPACLGSSLLQAYARDEMASLFSYDEDVKGEGSNITQSGNGSASGSKTIPSSKSASAKKSIASSSGKSATTAASDRPRRSLPGRELKKSN